MDSLRLVLEEETEVCRNLVCFCVRACVRVCARISLIVLMKYDYTA